MWQHGLSFFFLMRWSRWWNMSNYITVLLAHIFLYMRCQYHVTTRIVFLLLGDDDLADEACQIISQYCWHTYSYTCDVNIMWQHGLSFFFLVRWSRWWSMSNYITVLLAHILLYMRCQYHVTTRIVFLLLDEMISLMKHVKLYHGIVRTHIPIHAMSISCDNTDCLSSSWWDDLADETCLIISRYCWHTYSYTCDVNIMWQHGLSLFFLMRWSRWWNMSNYITVLLAHIFLYMRCQYHVTTRIVFLLLGEMISLMKHVKLYHGIVRTHIPIHAMSISCDNTDCLFFFLMRWSRWWNMSNYITVLLVHILLYMRCQYHVTTRIVFLLLGEMISLMKHVKLYHSIVGTHIPIHAMSISCDNTDCLSSSWWDDLADETCLIISQYCWHTYSYTCDVNIMWQHGLSFFFLVKWSRWWSMSNYITVLLAHIFLYMRCQYHVTTRIVFLLLGEANEV